MQPETNPREIARSLSPSARRILAEACRPLAEQETFPGLLNDERKAMIAGGLIKPRGYHVEATPLGHAVQKAATTA